MPDFVLPHQHNHSTLHENVKAHLDNINTFQIVADIFKQLGDASRLRIFWLLCHQEECVINVAAIVNMTTPAVSHHLKLLRSAGLITSRRDGKEVYYKISDSQAAALLHSMIEEITDLACPQPYRSQSEQLEVIRRIHDQLLENLGQRITIEELAKKYLMNTTTLKEAFKAVYGVSIAAHIKEHRMKKAAALLCDTNDTIQQIAQAVGYESQSKFTSAFKDTFQTLPSKYRKQHQKNQEPKP